MFFVLLTFSQVHASEYRCENSMVKYWGVESEGFKNSADRLELFVSSGLLVHGYRLMPWRDLYPNDQRFQVVASFKSLSRLSPIKVCKATFNILKYADNNTIDFSIVYTLEFEKKSLFMTASDCAWNISRSMKGLPKCGLGR